MKREDATRREHMRAIIESMMLLQNLQYAADPRNGMPVAVQELARRELGGTR